jgi:hypothetical protein
MITAALITYLLRQTVIERTSLTVVRALPTIAPNCPWV